jgi:hypothetical protein
MRDGEIVTHAVPLVFGVDDDPIEVEDDGVDAHAGSHIN